MLKNSKKGLIAVSILSLMIANSANIAAMTTNNINSFELVSSSTTNSSVKKAKEGVHVSIYSIASSFLNKTKSEIRESEKSGISLYKQLTSAGKLDAFKEEYLSQLKTALNAAVKEKEITKNKADEILNSEKTRIGNWNESNPLRGKCDSKRTKFGRVNISKIAATVLGKSEEEIKIAFNDGNLGDLLISASKLNEFKTACLSDMKLKLDEAVKSKTLTQAEADEKYTFLKAKIDAYDGTQPLFKERDHNRTLGEKDKAQ